GAPPARASEPRAALPSIDWPPRHTGPLLEIARKPVTLDAFLQTEREDRWDEYMVGKARESLPRELQVGSVFRGAYGAGTVCDLFEEYAPTDPGLGRTGRFRFVTNRYPAGELEAVRERYKASSISLLFLFNCTDFEVREPKGVPRGMVFCLSSWGGQKREKP